MSDIAEKFKAPVISGNVSFYNETEGIKINPTPAVGVIGVEKLSSIRTLPFKNEGDKIIIIGKTYDELGGSEYHRAVHNLEQGEAPKIRIDDELAAANTVLDLIENDGDYVKFLEGEDKLNIKATHDVSAGGIAIALSEMVMKGKLGCEIDISNVPAEENISDNDLLFSESHGRYIIAVEADKAEEIVNSIDVDAAIIGEVKGDSLIIKNNDETIVDFAIDELNGAYTGVIEKYMA